LRALVQLQNDEKWKRVVVLIIQKYICKWMAKHAYLKLLSATSFI
jgi:hypothetical protein